MSRRIVLLFVAGVTLIIAQTAAAQVASQGQLPGLSRAQANRLSESVVPAWQFGNPLTLIEALEPLVAQLNEAQRAAADNWLAENGLPPLTEMLVDARLALVEQRLADQANAPAPNELVLLLQGLNDRLDEILAERERHAAFQDHTPPPASFAEFEQRFWDMHVLNNRLLIARRWAQYGQHEVVRARRVNLRRLDSQQREVLTTDFARLESDVVQLAQELAERTLELRLARLTWAEDTLARNSNLRDRFQAAFAVDLDGGELLAFVEQLHDSGAATTVPGGDEDADAEAAVASVHFRPQLADPALPDRVRQQVASAREHAGEDLLAKSRMLYTGLHWWLRGRYGAGTEGAGLLKSPAALATPQAQFALYMPLETPRPTDPLVGDAAVPQVDRRHHYLWQFETRRIDTEVTHNKDVFRGDDERVVSVTHLSRFY